jgi:putative transposon-encoded protein
MTIKKIKIIESEEETEGDFMKKKVSKFAHAGHIIVPRKYIGREADVLISTEQKLKWMLSYGELREFIDGCTKMLDKHGGRFGFFVRRDIDNIRSDDFDEDDLLGAVNILKKSKDEGHKMLVKKVIETYGL